MNERKRYRTAGVAIALLVLLGVSGAYSTPVLSQDETTTCEMGDQRPECQANTPQLFGCYRNDGERLLRVIGEWEKCGEHESFMRISAGEPGAQGPAGPPGADGVPDMQRVSASSPADSSGIKTVVASCPEGKKALGGGFRLVAVDGGRLPVLVESSEPTWDLDGWAAVARETAGYQDRWQLEATAICAKPATA